MNMLLSTLKHHMYNSELHAKYHKLLWRASFSLLGAKYFEDPQHIYETNPSPLMKLLDIRL